MLVVVGTTAATLADGDAWGPVDRTHAEVVGDARCVACHPAEHASWHATYHRTMTQRAPEGVLAPFAGEQLHALGFTATMSRDGSGHPQVRIVDEAGVVVLDATVELAVGSHRYQQYVAPVARGGGELHRLPIAWHIGEARWIHLNDAFLAPDGAHGDRDDFLRHLARYNDNCLFCHNTEPVPGLASDGSFTTTVGQWGIACEACHGRASEHVARHDSIARRVWSVVGPDGSITHPGRIDVARGNDVCGRCHGQRIGRDIANILAHGDGFIPGEALDRVSRPILADSRVGDTTFADRFWPDGTPRLSAHEYQGLLTSPCDGLSCATCHDMHGDEPAMQLRADWDPIATCRGCHDEAPADDHGGHGDAVRCTDCHMPRTTYGLLEGMISHRITSPDPGAWLGRHDAPDACTQCHVDRTRAWAAEAMAGLGLRGTAGGDGDERESWASRVVLDLHGGDPIQRALAAHALARPQVPVDPRLRLSWIVDAMADDYAAVRWMAWRGAKALVRSAEDDATAALLHAWDPAAPLTDRLVAWQRLRRALGPSVLDDAPHRREALEARRDDRAIWIGE
jgi:predicted CXXCH cytochrome family protein